MPFGRTPSSPQRIRLLALADQPNAAELCQEVYGDRVALFPM